MIIIISAVFLPEPVVSAVLSHDIAAELAKTNEVEVITPKPSRPKDFEFSKIRKKELYQHTILNSFTYPKSQVIGRMYESLSFGIHAAKFIRSKQKQISCIYLNSFPLISQFLVVREAKRYSIPSVVHMQDIYPESLMTRVPIFKRLINWALCIMDNYTFKNATYILSISERMQKYYLRNRTISINRLKLIRNWQDERAFIDYHGDRNDISCDREARLPLTFMYLGNIGPVAQLEYVIRSFISMRSKNSKLIVAGSGSKKQDCIKLVHSLGAKNISFIDVPIGKVPEIQSRADIMLLPILKGAAMSSIPSKLIAYMFSSKPILASVDSESDSADTIISANCGWVVPPGEESALVTKMTEIASLPPETLKNLGRNGYNFALEYFSKSKNLHKLIEILESVKNTSG